MFAASKSGSPAEATDAQFNYVTMLLHGDGTNGAQNNTFLDSSTNNFTITRNGNTTQGTFTPYGSNWSNYFDGSGDYLTAPSDAAFALGSIFTIEAWIFPNATPSGEMIITCFGTTNGFQLGYQSGTSFGFAVSGVAWRLTASTIPTPNTWNHVVVTRSGTGTNQTSIFINGTRTANGTVSDALTTTSSCFIGRDFSGAGQYAGFVSNIRIVKGTAVYDPTQSTITVPTAPLTAITNTSLLTCQSNRFIDNSTNNFTITKNGDVSVQRFSPFSPTSAYSTSVIGGSGYFDGSGDYLSVSNSGLFGSGDWSIEFWVNAPVGQTDKPIIDARNSAGGSGSTTGFTIGMISSTEIRVWSNGEKIRATANYVNQWLHLAVVKSGSTTTMYFNGVSVGTTTAIGTMSDTSFLVGAGYYGSTSINAYGNFYTSNMRVVKGSAVYTSNFTPPTAPVSAIASTVLLMDYTNAGILDNAMMNDLETVGNAQISTSVKKYGTGSMLFDGNGDNLSTPTTPNLNMGTGNWTIECWVYILSRTLNYPLIFGNNNGSYTTGALALVNSNSDSASYNDRFCLSVKDHLNAPTLVASSTNSSNTWYHLAVVRNGTSLVMYRDGTSVASATISSGLGFDWGKLGSRIGGGNWDGAQSYFNGYIDDLRITNGVARYTATFTPPTTAFADKG